MGLKPSKNLPIAIDLPCHICYFLGLTKQIKEPKGSKLANLNLTDRAIYRLI